MKIELVKGDITRLKVAAIVNAANSRLMGGGGVDGAIHRAAGPKLLEECQKIFQQRGECLPGSAVLTPAYNLNARFVIHAVGPRDGVADQDELLAKAYQSSLQLACENYCESVAFPCISTGVYRFPKPLAARIALAAISDFLSGRADGTAVLQKIQLVCFDEENYQIYRGLGPSNR